MINPFANITFGVRGCDLDDLKQLSLALFILDQVASAEGHHVRRMLVEVAYDPYGCGSNAIACTGGSLTRQRVATLVYKPAHTSLVELAVTLRHEARHWSWGADGQLYLLPHTDEGPLREQWDWIYATDAVLRQQLHQYMNSLIPRPSPALAPSPSPAVAFLKGFFGTAALLGLGYAGVAAAQHLSAPRVPHDA